MTTPLSEAIRDHSCRHTLSDGTEADILKISAVAEIAHKLELAGHTVEAEALKLGIFPIRYLRNMTSISATDQIKLLESSLALVGLGGLGGNLLEIFLRTGIGRIRASDGDTFEESNLNRQALSSINTCGILKADVAIGRTFHINPSITIDAWDEYLNRSTFPDFLNGCDIAIDALGGLSSRLALHHAAAEAGIPLVTGALAGWTCYVGVVRPGQPGPAEIMGSNNAAEEILGCPAPSVAFVASLMATETIKILTGTPSVIAGKMLIIDLKSLTFDTISL